MANDIVLGSALRTNLLSLQSTQRSIDSTQLRLATGKKVNSALDNPQSFFQAQSLNNRASDLTRLLDGIGQSVRTIEEADKGVTALSGLINQASSIAENAQSAARAAEGFVTLTSSKNLTGAGPLVAASGGALVAGDDIKISVALADGTKATSGDINIDAADTVYNLVADINADTAINTFVKASLDTNGNLKLTSLKEGASVRLGDGTTTPGSDGYSYLGLDNIVGTENTAATTRQGGTFVAGRKLESQAALPAAATNGEYKASSTLGVAGFTGGFATATTDDLQITLTVDNQSVTIGSFTDASTIQSVVDGINTSGLDAEASFDTVTGKISIAFGDKVSGGALQFETNDAASTGDVAFGFGSGVLGYGAIGGANDLTVAAGATSKYSEKFTFGGSNADLTQFTKDYEKIRTQITDLVGDANYRGVNLLKGDTLTTTFNEDRSSTLTTSGEDFTAAGLGLKKADFTNSSTIQLSLDAVASAQERVRNFGSSIANDLSIIQTRRDFTEQTITTLKSGASDLTDADPNEEGANLLSLQTRQQLGVTSLSLASQSQQSVLRLF